MSKRQISVCDGSFRKSKKTNLKTIKNSNMQTYIPFLCIMLLENMNRMVCSVLCTHLPFCEMLDCSCLPKTLGAHQLPGVLLLNTIHFCSSLRLQPKHHILQE